MSQAEESRAISAATGSVPANGSASLGLHAPPRLDELSPEKLHEKCTALARNLWWSWHPEVTNLFRELDPIRWRQLDHNPIALLAEFTPERLEARAAELVLYSRINQAYRRLKEYMAGDSTWSNVHAGVLGSKPVVYFSAEFGIHESVPIYSGGLGVLSGDHIKSASGLGIPLIAVGLFYDQGYFKQQLDIDGYQHEEYLQSRTEVLPIEPALGADGKPISVQIDTRSGPIFAKVWKMAVGRINLYLLDSDVEVNNPEDRELTSRLYGGDSRLRIRQELVLGVGGVRAIRAMGIVPGVYHLNEGHSVFATLEAARRPRPVRQRPDRGIPRPDAGLARDFPRPADGHGTGRSQQPRGAVLHDGAGAEDVAAGECRQRVAWPREPQDVVQPLAVAGRGRGADRPHHQRRARAELALLADAPALRPHLSGELVSPHGRARRLAEDP